MATSDQSAGWRSNAFNPLVPERGQLVHDTSSAINAVSTAVPVTSAIQGDCLSSTTAGTPMPLSLLAPSGISRPQLLTAAQAIGVFVLPSYAAAQGGVVLDRVLASTGGGQWWATVNGRVKAQSLWTGRHKLRSTVTDPGQYSLNANTRVLLGTNTVWRARLDLEPSYIAPAAEPSPYQACYTAPVLADAGRANHLHVSGSTQLRRRLKQSEFKANFAVNHRTLAADGHGYDVTPVTTSLEIGTPCNRPNWLQYRLGLMQVTAPDLSVEETTGSGASQPLRSAVYAQGAAAVTGSHTLWQAARARRAPGAPSTSTDTTVAAPSSAAPRAQPPSPALSISPHNPLRRTLKKLLNRHKRDDGEDAADSRQQGTRSRFGDALSDDGGALSKQASGKTKAGNGIWGSNGQQLPRPETVLEAVIDATHSASRLQEDVVGVTQWVKDGGLIKAASTAGAGSGPRTTPWSAFTGSPHIKLSSAAGLTSSCQLLSISHTPKHATASTQEGSSADPTSGPASTTGAARLARLSESARASVGNVASRVMMGEGRVSPFASGAVSVQLGHFQRWMLDFTQLTVRLDGGFRGVSGGATAATSPARLHPAFSLESPSGSGSPQLSLSFCQQLLGPLRMHAQARYSLLSLDPDSATGPDIGGTGLTQFFRRVPGMAGLSLQDVVYGLDMGVPGSVGAARLVAWVAPLRKEAMVEIRVF